MTDIEEPRCEFSASGPLRKSFKTGIQYRLRSKGGYRSIVIGDERLSSPQILQWLAAMTPQGVTAVLDAVRQAIRADDPGAN
jgi:hypothetical protein